MPACMYIYQVWQLYIQYDACVCVRVCVRVLVSNADFSITTTATDFL